MCCVSTIQIQSSKYFRNHPSGYLINNRWIIQYFGHLQILNRNGVSVYCSGNITTLCVLWLWNILAGQVAQTVYHYHIWRGRNFM